MANELQRASVFAIKEETTVGTLVSPDAASQFIPLRPGFSMTPNLEELANDELENSIGAKKSLTGKESPEGSHPAYLKHSNTEGTAPETILLYESAMGDKTENATEYDTVGGSTAGTSTAAATVVVDTGEGAQFEVGQGLLIKDGTNGRSVRNITGISGDTLTLNFNLDNAPASGVNLGRAILVKPASTGHPSYSAWAYNANGGLIQAAAGCRTNSITSTFTAGQQAEVEFSYAGIEYFFNPIEITASNNKIDITDDGGTIAVTLTNDIYKSPIALATHISSAATAASVGSGNDTITCTYSSSTGKFTFSSDGATFSLLWNTGANTANSVGTTIGFDTAADDTGSTSYEGDNALSLAASLTPTYDGANNLVVKNAELTIGGFADNQCRNASEVTVTIGTPTEDIDDLCAESGLEEKIILSREVTMDAVLNYKRYESHLFDDFINNTSISAMLNIGNKDSGGDWIEGTVVNFNFSNASITSHNITGDDIVRLELSIKAFVLSSTNKDVYINFL